MKKTTQLAIAALFSCTACSPQLKHPTTNTQTPAQDLKPSLYDLKSATPAESYRRTTCTSVFAQHFNTNHNAMLNMIEAGKESWYNKAAADINYHVNKFNNPKAGSFYICTSFQDNFAPHIRNAQQAYLGSNQELESCIDIDSTKDNGAAFMQMIQPIYSTEKLATLRQAIQSPLVTGAKLCVDYGLG